MATDLQSAPFVHLGTCPNIAKSLDSALCAQKQTIPLTALRFPIAQQEMTVQDGQLAILEAGNFTNDISICQVGWHVFLMALKYFDSVRSAWRQATLFSEIATT